jgi:hypothetical protein
MKTYSGIGGTGKPGSGLSFWRYSKEGCGQGGLCNEHMTLNDDGSSFFGGELTASTINATNINFNNIIRGADTNIHIVSKRDLFLMSPGNTYIYKNLPETFWEKPSGNLIVQGNLSVDGNIITNVNSAISFLPRGSIIMFSGAVPGGWFLCDGNNGTPNLINRFVLGGSWASKVYGGVAEVTLTEAQMPNHTHSSYEFLAANAGYRWYPWGGAAGGLHGGGAWGMSSAQPFEAKGSNQPHTNMPPYCVLIYIMKAY